MYPVVPESAVGADVLTNTAVFSAAFSDTVTGADVIIGAFLWNPIDDAQNPNWSGITANNDANWQEITGEASTNWQKIDTVN